MNDWLGFRLMCLSVVIWLLKGCHSIGIDVTDIIDWLVIILVVTLFLKDCHGNEIEETEMNDSPSFRLM